MAHWYSSFWDLNQKKKVLSSNPVVYSSRSCQPFAQLALTWGVPTALSGGVRCCGKKKRGNYSNLAVLLFTTR